MSLRSPIAFLVLQALLFEPLFVGPCLADDKTFTELFEEVLSDLEPPKTVETPEEPARRQEPRESRAVKIPPPKEDKAVPARRFNFWSKFKPVSAPPKAPPAEKARVNRPSQPSVTRGLSPPDRGASPGPKVNFSPRKKQAAAEPLKSQPASKPRPAPSVSPAKVPQIKYVPTTVQVRGKRKEEKEEKKKERPVVKPRKPAVQESEPKPLKVAETPDRASETISAQPLIDSVQLPVADREPEVSRRARIEAALARVREIEARTPAAQRIPATAPPRQVSKAKKAELARAVLAKYGVNPEQGGSTS